MDELAKPSLTYASEDRMTNDELKARKYSSTILA